MNGQAKVLVVDDDESLRLLLRTLLERIGCSVVEAADGREGLHAFDKEGADLVLVDLRMPVMDGLTMIAGLKKKAPDTPVIVVSGTGNVSDAVDSLRLGAWDYMVKPVADVRQFEIIIRRTLEKARLINENTQYREHLEALIKDRTEELGESEARYRRLLESVTSYVYTVIMKDGLPDRTIHGPGCETVTGFSPGEYAADPYLWYRMIHDDDRSLVLDVAERILGEHLPVSLEHRISHKDGGFRWVQNTLVPHRAIGGQLLSYDGIIIDITERKEMEKHRLRLAQLESERKTIVLETFNQLMVTLSHYLLNSNAIIGGMVRRCKRVKSDAEKLSALESIEEQAKKTEILIAALKKMTKVRTADYTQAGSTVMVDIAQEIEGKFTEKHEEDS
jgi:phosphoserine phosphatase RsbU/P